MNGNLKTIAAAAALALGAGCVHAGTWVNGYYVDGPLCTVCDGTRLVSHGYGTTICSHCEGTGIEPPEVERFGTVIVDELIAPLPRPSIHHRNHRRSRPALRPPRDGGKRPAVVTHKAKPTAPKPKKAAFAKARMIPSGRKR